MEIFLNGEEIEFENYADAENLIDILSRINYEVNGEIIKELLVDGENLNPHHPEENPELEDISYVEVTTAETEDIIKETLSDVQGFLPRVRKGFELATGKVNSDDDEFSRYLDDSREGLEWCMEVMDKIIQLTRDVELQKDYNSLKRCLSTKVNTLSNNRKVMDSEELTEFLHNDIILKIEELEKTVREIARHYNSLW